MQQNDPVDHSVAEPTQAYDGDDAFRSMCGGIHSDKTAVCRYHLSGSFGCKGIYDGQGKGFIMIENEMNTNDYMIRLEKKEDYRAVESLVRESFWNV